MKQVCTITTVLSICMVCSFMTPGTAQDFDAVLSGNHQPLPVLSLASGTINATLNGDTLSVSGEVGNISSGIDTTVSGGVHIHNGLAGRNGGVELVLQPVLSEGLDGAMFEVASNTFILDEEQLTAIQCRGLYVNVHSVDYRNGEVRGQLLPAAEEVYSTNLFGSNVVPSIMSEATGALMLEVNGNELVVSGSINNLSTPLTAIHIHNGAAGMNGGVAQGLTATLSDDSLSAEIRGEDNIYQLTNDQIADLRSQKWYVNAHSQRFGSGEIRGQVTPLATAKFRTHLSGSNEAPPITSYAHGKLVYGLTDGNLTVSGSFAGLESDLAVNILGGMHIHLGMTGRNGSVAFPLTVDVGDDSRSGYLDPAKNMFAVSGDTLSALMGRALYINVHSLGNSGGEIRGQILPESQYFLNGTFTGSQMVTPVQSTGSGACVVEILGTQLTFSGTFENLSSPLLISFDNGAHIHFAPVGARGPHLINLVATPDDDIASARFRAADNRFTVSQTLKDSLKARIGYISIHSENVMPGELRGQLMHEACAYFYAPLSGAEQTPAVLTNGEGAAMLEYNGNTAIVVGSFKDLSSPVTASHVHGSIVGRNGPVVIPLDLTVSDSLTSGVWTVADNITDVSGSTMDTVRQRMTYVNVHSTTNGGGELRGNFRPLAQNYYLANLRGKNTTNPAASSGMGALILEQTGNALIVSGSFTNLMGDFTASHIHQAMAGMNGGVKIPLSLLVGDDLRSGVFLADSNQFTMD
ncbi:MAG: CHRD domain-containing protein, partial [Saprospiraceae bacterium]|nr:CHRD domain-containing protein [Saprospiraceae bacterium]